MSDPIDLEEYLAQGKDVPKTGPYKIRVNKDHHTWPNPTIKGREILDLAKKSPHDKFAAYQRIRGQKALRIQLEEDADVTAKGTERFETLPLEQTEGSTSE